MLISEQPLCSLTLASLPHSFYPPSHLTGCVGRHLAMWGRWGSRPVPQECGILIWAICNDRPPMSAEEWQVERLWQVLIAVRKSNWRMCQLHPHLPFVSSPIAVVLCCCCSFWPVSLKGEWRIFPSPSVLFSPPPLSLFWLASRSHYLPT